MYSDINADSLIMGSIKRAMGSDFKYFNIEKSEVLMDGPLHYCVTMKFQPQELEFGESKLKSDEAHFIEFNLDEDTDVYITQGEGFEMAVTKANIYSLLFWSGATVAA